MREIYLDNSATTPLSPEARAKFLAVSDGAWGNPSSLHALGLRAARELEAARAAVRRALGATGGAVVFTGGGSEANNLAIFGRAYAKARYRGGKIITTAGEHASVSAPLARLREEGFDIVEIPTVGGALDMAALVAALDTRVCLVTLMTVNNETGALYDIAAAVREVRRAAPNALVHTDATQALGKIPLSVKPLGVDAVTVSAHKIEGPKGTGALWISDAVLKNKGLVPHVLGGGQEGGLRAGTVDVPSIAAFAVACEMAHTEGEARRARLADLSTYLIDRLQKNSALSELTLNLPARRAPHILNLTLPNIKSETMLHYLSGEGIFVASGSACSSHGKHSSPALAAFGLTARQADCSIRVSLSYRTTEDELDVFVNCLATGVARLSRMR